MVIKANRRSKGNFSSSVGFGGGGGGGGVEHPGHTTAHTKE